LGAKAKIDTKAKGKENDCFFHDCVFIDYLVDLLFYRC
jgi:hypothetical protein